MTQVTLDHGYVWAVFAYDTYYPGGEDVLAIYDNMEAAQIHKEMVKSNEKGVWFDHITVRQIAVHSKCRDVFESGEYAGGGVYVRARQRWD